MNDLDELAQAAYEANEEFICGSISQAMSKIAKARELPPPGLTFSYNTAMNAYRARLPWWRRWFWRRLSKHEQQMALLNAVLDALQQEGPQ